MVARIEWRYQTASKLHPAHAYLVPAADRLAIGICGEGTARCWTKRMDTASPKRKYPVRKCRRCLELIEKQGEE